MADWEQPSTRGASTLGDRVRTLRRSAGLSQAQLGEGRFTKEYVSQIERGKTRPTSETLEFLADRLATDPEFLEHGVSRADGRRIEHTLAEAEGLADAARFDDALAAFERARALAEPSGDPATAQRLLLGIAWVRIRQGRLDEAMALLEEAARAAVGAEFGDVDRAQVVFLVGVVRYSQSRIADALVLLDEALALVEGEAAADGLRSDVFHWRARCHRRNRDWVAAEEDVERSLELAEAISDTRRVADALFQASLVSQRQGRWALARTQAERARALFEELGDHATVGRLLNNLAGLNHLLGNVERAIALLEEAFGVFVDLGLEVDAGYVCSSLAEIRLESGDLEASEAQARKALALLGDRVDHLQEVGTAQLTLGRTLAARGSLDDAESWIARADASFERARSAGHRSTAWIAHGDLESRRGNDRAAAAHYRRAARTLQEVEA